MRRALAVLGMVCAASVASADPDPLPARDVRTATQAAFLHPVLYDMAIHPIVYIPLSPQLIPGSPFAGAGGGGGGGVTNPLLDDVALFFGTGSDASIRYNTTQTPDSWYLGTGIDSGAIIIAEQADVAFDFAHADQANPTLFIHSANQSTTEWISLFDDGTRSWISTGQTFAIKVGASNVAQVSTTFLNLTSTTTIGWPATVDATAGADLLLGREAAATLQFGADVNGAAVAQTIKAHDGITGTDVAGANLTVAAGRGTGAGAPGKVILQTSTTLGTGTTAQTLATRLTASEVGVALASGSAVASAAAITPTGNVFHVTGTTTVTSITSTAVVAGECIVLIFDGVLTFTDGSNLVLAGNFTTTANDTISLCFDGTNWYETARAVN